MRAEDLQPFIDAKPFRAFRIIMGGGKAYDVLHRDMIQLTRRAAYLFFSDKPGAPADRVEMISLAFIERIERSEIPTPPLRD